MRSRTSVIAGMAMLAFAGWAEAGALGYSGARHLLARTDQGTASAHFVMGRSGARGNIRRVTPSGPAGGNFRFAVDFRGYHAALVEQAWGVDSR
jgi:hypothetical protein